jgi:saccharopine dehydrogenase (NAD+, L-lysine-forming)
MSKSFWLRAETKENEFRRALTPDSCKKIIEAGHKVTVEDWKDSIIPTSKYQEVGCEIVPEHSWMEAPKDTIVVGLKALSNAPSQYIHTHIYFAHCYKEQDGWSELLSKFKTGEGKIIDLEFMVDDNGRRTNAFGYWAGYVGASLGALYAKCSDSNDVTKKLQAQKQFPDKQDLLDFVKNNTTGPGSGIIIGRSGRSGTGAYDFLSSLGWKVTGWDMEETKKGGPFKEILEHDLFVNCVLAMKPMAPFITKDLVSTPGHNLKMISDVSCDPDSDCNMVPLYEKATTLSEPIVKVTEQTSLTAIDNLPSILPKESSYDFSSQLENYIINYNENEGPVARALEHFKKHVSLV